MKRSLLLAGSALLLMAITISCKDVIKVTDVTLIQTAFTLPVGETEILIATVHPEDATQKEVSWVSDNPEVASVVNGLVTALKEGTAKITVTTREGKKKASCFIEICKYVEGEPQMIIVDGGTFTMGCTRNFGNECHECEFPRHSVTVSSFSIGKYPITQKQWEVFTGKTILEQAVLAGTTKLYGVGDNYPVYYVSWDDAQVFIENLNAATGKNYRLATEAEWEFAASGGTKSNYYRYSGSNKIDEVAWYTDNSNMTSQPVGTKQPNELGIYDMSGNVREWCYDWYALYSSDFHQTNPQGPTWGQMRIARGGSWRYAHFYCRVSDRFYAYPETCNLNSGFRVALSL